MQPATHAPAHHGHAQELSFWRKYVFSVDHKVIGKQYMSLSLFMAIFGGLTALLIRWQLAWPEAQIPGLGWVPPPTLYEGAVEPDGYNILPCCSAPSATS